MTLRYPPILAYHRVAPEPDRTTPTLAPEAFDRQMNWIARNRRPVGLADWVGRIEQKKPIPVNEVVVTFDDGTADLYPHAFPILKRHRIPALIFLITGMLDQPGYLTRDQVREMAAAGIGFGSHTVSHCYLPDADKNRLEQEVTKSRETIRQLAGTGDWISYPAGGFDPSVQAAVRRAGYRAACTTNRGTDPFRIDRWALRRVSMHARAGSPLGMAWRCSGWASINRRLRPPC
ncbi:MAG: hypothetical protein COV76_03990 [Candidatus Omnitrophica bacterium CG11_big_fil_rev_8_21_14_0_20_64_10]|nr:MAG: hypothetical protein COV76_03990 [Candidatus Omnitrophica bacterium CG11_big_fil_rev_8_21_14_0_20_64_10]